MKLEQYMDLEAAGKFAYNRPNPAAIERLIEGWVRERYPEHFPDRELEQIQEQLDEEDDADFPTDDTDNKGDVTYDLLCALELLRRWKECMEYFFDKDFNAAGMAATDEYVFDAMKKLTKDMLEFTDQWEEE